MWELICKITLPGNLSRRFKKCTLPCIASVQLLQRRIWCLSSQIDPVCHHISFTHGLFPLHSGERAPCMDHAPWPRLDQRPACCRILKRICEYSSHQWHCARSVGKKTSLLFHWFHFFHPLISTVCILSDISRFSCCLIAILGAALPSWRGLQSIVWCLKWQLSYFQPNKNSSGQHKGRKRNCSVCCEIWGKPSPSLGDDVWICTCNFCVWSVALPVKASLLLDCW